MAGLLIDLAMNMAHMQRDVQQASKDINRFSKNATKDLGDIKNSFSGLTMAVKAFVASFVTYKLTAGIKDTALLTARVETLGIVLERVGQNVGYSRDQMFEFMEGVKAMGITTQESERSIIRMVQANLDLTKSNQLARVAQDAAVIGNINSSEAMQRLIHGIVTLNPKVLRNIGILVNFNSEYQRAAAVMDRTVESLTANEKQQIAFNAAIKAGENIAGSYAAAMGTVGKQITSLPRYVEELKLKVGELFKPALTLLVTEYTEALKDADSAMAEFIESGDAKKWGEDLAAKLETILDTLKGFKNIYDSMPQEAIEIGILGVILTGKFSPLRLVAALYIINDVLSSLGMGIGDVIKRYKEAVGAIDNFWNAITGKGTFGDAIGPGTPGWDEFIKGIQSIKEKIKEVEEVEKELTKAQLDLRKKFNKESQALYKLDTDFQLEQLSIQYVAYQKVVEDKAELERWFQSEKQRIEAEGANRSVKLYQELYEATDDVYYARLATEAFQKVLDAEMAKNLQILNSEEDALAIRFLHNEQFVNDLYGLMDDIVEAEIDTANRRIEVTEDYVQRRLAAEAVITDPGIGQFTGLPVGSGTEFTVITQQSGGSTSGWVQSFFGGIDTLEISFSSLTTTTDDLTDALDELESRLSSAESLMDQFTDFEQERERRDWGATEYQAELGLLTAYQTGLDPESETYYDDSMAAFADILDVLRHLDDIEQEALAAQEQLLSDYAAQGQTISEWVQSLQFSETAPVMSMESFAIEFQRLLALAEEDTAYVGQFLNFAQQYLEYAQAYGGDYAAVYQSIVDAVEDLGAQYDLTAILGAIDLSTTIDDVRTLIEELDSVGISAGDFMDALSAIGFDPATMDAEDLAKVLVSMGLDAGTAARLVGRLTGDIGDPGGLGDVIGDTTTDTSGLIIGVEEDLQGAIELFGDFIQGIADSIAAIPTPGEIEDIIESAYQEIIAAGPAEAVLQSWIKGTEAANGFYWYLYNQSGVRIQTIGPTREQPPAQWVLGAGGLTGGTSIAGEIGPEWVVPTYEPQRSKFLKDAGVDMDAILKAVTMAAGHGGGEIHIHLSMNSREFGYAMVSELDKNPALVNKIRSIR